MFLLIAYLEAGKKILTKKQRVKQKAINYSTNQNSSFNSFSIKKFFCKGCRFFIIEIFTGKILMNVF